MFSYHKFIFFVTLIILTLRRKKRANASGNIGFGFPVRLRCRDVYEVNDLCLCFCSLLENQIEVFSNVKAQKKIARKKIMVGEAKENFLIDI